MRWVSAAAQRPHKCAVLPMVGNTNARGGFIDTGYDLHGWDPHVYVSVIAVQEMAKMIGWVPPGDIAGQAAAVGRLEARIAELEAEVAENAKVVEAAHTLLEVAA